MSLWLRCLCRRPLGEHFGVEALRNAIERFDFALMAEGQGLDDEAGQAAENALRLEGGGDDPLLIYYRPADDYFIRVDLWRTMEAREEVTELADELGDGQEFERVRVHLDETVESVAFDLKQSDLEGMGWPIAFYTAMWLAERGDGLVEWEGAWFDPKTSYSDPIADE